MKTKKCSGCKKTLEIDNFVKDIYRVDKLRNYCKECERKRKQEYLLRKEVGELVIAPVIEEDNYNTSNIIILSESEAIQTMPWLKAESLSSQYNKDVGFVGRGLLACRNAGVSEQYFIDRYFKDDKTIPFDRDVDYQSRLIQGLIHE